MGFPAYRSIEKKTTVSILWKHGSEINEGLTEKFVF